MDGLGDSGRGAASLQLRSHPTYPKRSVPSRDKNRASATNALLASPPSLPQLGWNIILSMRPTTAEVACEISERNSPFPPGSGTTRHKLVKPIKVRMCATHVHALGAKTRKDRTVSLFWLLKQKAEVANRINAE